MKLKEQVALVCMLFWVVNRVQSGIVDRPEKTSPASGTRNEVSQSPDELKSIGEESARAGLPVERQLKMEKSEAPKTEQKERQLFGKFKGKNKPPKPKKKKKKLKPLVPPKPPRRPKIPKLITMRPKRRRRPKDIIDRLPSTLDKYKYKVVDGKKYMIVPKYRPIKTYMKHHDREHKEYPDTDKFVSADAQLETILPQTYGTPSRKKKLRMFKDMINNGDNPRFNPGMHSDLEYDYFNLTFPYLDTRLDRLKQIRDYIRKWMNIDPENEDVEVRYFQQAGETILNRVIVSYFNRQFYKKKRYIIDFKFGIERIIKKPLLKIARVVRSHVPKEKYYGKNYEFTLKYKCGVIRKKLLNPKIFKCTPVINEQHYILNNLFLVDMVLYRKMYKGLLFSFEAYKPKKPKPLYPNPIHAMTEPLGDPREMILRRLKTLQPRYQKTYKHIQKVLERPEFRAAIGNLKADIAEYKLYFNSQVMLGEKQYQTDLKTDLWELQKQLYSHLDHVYRNYEMMLRKVEETNSYGINQEVLKMRSALDTLQNFAVYLIKRRRFILEEHIRKILNFLDYIDYKKNRKFESEFFDG